MREAERIYNKRETPEEREERLRKLQEEREDRLRREQEEKEEKRDRKCNRELSKILATVVQPRSESGKKERPGDNRRPRVDRDQCAYCKEKGHWVKDCPKRPQDSRKTSTRVLSLDQD